MNNAVANRYLESYGRLEGAIRNNYRIPSDGYLIETLVRDKNFEEYDNKLNICRKIRNILVHGKQETGEYVIYPTEELISFLDKITNLILFPPKVTSITSQK